MLGVFAKSVLDKRQLKFSKIFEYKEARYKAMMIMMFVAMNPSEYELDHLRNHRPDIDGIDGLDRELKLEYYNAMLYASDRVLDGLEAFLRDKTEANWRAVTHAMRKDLYL